MSGKRLKAVVLFAGIGGTSLGLEWAGFEELLAVDNWEMLKPSWERNFPGKKLAFWDIMLISGRKILRKCRLRKGELDLLTASPPCQGFSTLNVRGNERDKDEKNALFPKTIELISEMMSKAFVIENVCGLIKGRKRGLFNEILKTFPDSYIVRVKRMNSAFYGCATARPRLIWFGIRKDINVQPEFPKPLGKVLAIKDMLDGVVPHSFKTLSERFSALWRNAEPGQSFDRPLGRQKYFSFRKVNPFQPCPTVTSSPFKLIHWKEPRTLSIEELKRITSFPDGFEIVGSMSFQWNAIGNAVMPRFAEAIFRKIREVLQ